MLTVRGVKRAYAQLQVYSDLCYSKPIAIRLLSRGDICVIPYEQLEHETATDNDFEHIRFNVCVVKIEPEEIESFEPSIEKIYGMLLDSITDDIESGIFDIHVNAPLSIKKAYEKTLKDKYDMAVWRKK